MTESPPQGWWPATLDVDVIQSPSRGTLNSHRLSDQEPAMMPDTVVPATACPHYLTVAYVTATGRHDRCAGCLVRPVRPYGRYGISGPVSGRQRTTRSDPAGKGYTRRTAARGA